VVKGFRPNARDLQDFTKLGAKVNGSLEVSIANGVKVIKHNAESEPYFFGLLGDYKWSIKSPGPEPTIELQTEH
jgi:hypothetical protein